MWKFKAKDEIWDVDVSADGRYVVAGSRDNSVYFLNSLGELLGKYITKYFVSSVSISARGELFVAGSYDNNVYFFQKTTTRPPKPRYPKVIALKTTTDRTLVEGGVTTVEVTLQNIGDGVARNIRLSDSVPEGFELVEGNTSWAGELEPGGVEVVSYKIRANKLPVRDKVTYELPEVNVTYEDVRGVFYSFTGASILITVTPKLPPEQPPSVSIIDRMFSNLRVVTEYREKWFIPALGVLFLAFALALAVRRRRQSRVLRREKLMLLRRIKGEMGLEPMPLVEAVKEKSPIVSEGGYGAYKGETLNLLRAVKMMVRSGERPRVIRTFPKKPKGSFIRAVPYWLKALVFHKENKAYRAKNVALLENIKKAIG